MPIEKLIREDTYRITIRPTTDFAKGDVMYTRVDGYEYEGRFRTRDVGEPGGMQFIIGKLEGDVERAGREEARTRTQSVNLSKGDFQITSGRLIPTTARGRSELKDIEKKWGKLHYVGGDYFVPESEWERLQRTKYFENPNGGDIVVRGISRAEQHEARRAGISEGIIYRMKTGMRLSIEEEEELHGSGLVYVPGYKKARGIEVRSFLRKYRGLTPAREEALVKARSVWAGEDNPELVVPGYEPMTSKQRAKAMPGGRR